MKIAFASTDKIHIDQHFGWSKTFQLFEVNKEDSSFIKELDSSQEYEDEHEKLTYKIGTINEADMLYCTQIGPSASKMVQAAKIHPIRSSGDESIAQAIEKLQEMLNGNPPPWLLRIYYATEKRKEEG